MSAVDAYLFEESMEKEIQKFFDNQIYKIVKRSTVTELKSILRAVWSHRRKKLLMVEFLRIEFLRIDFHRKANHKIE